MTHKLFFWLLATFLLATAFPASAQVVQKASRIGFLANVATTAAMELKPFRERLRELGYGEGQNFALEHRYWEGKVERLPALAEELVGLKCDVIVTSGTEAGNAAKNATKTIPVVLAFGVDVLKLGFVEDLARPSGNITGMTSIGTELYGKRLELLMEAVPKLSRVAFLWSSISPSGDYTAAAVEKLARSLRLGINSFEVKEADNFEAVFQTALKNRANGMMLAPGGFFASHQSRIIDLAMKHRLPTMHSNAQHVEAGGLMTYAYDRPYQFRRAAEYVDKILKGTKVSDLPVERPKKFELVINLKTAKQIGLTIPPNLLVRADRVIK
jgi:putative tryptophan/tyrosine transport system substrate-binding protein